MKRMIETSTEYLLFIEPTAAPTMPIVDDLTRAAAALLRAARVPEDGYRGCHDCTGAGCRARSSNRDHYVRPLGTPEPVRPSDFGPYDKGTYSHDELWTHSLIVHYVACHRDECGHDDLAALVRLTAGADLSTVEPTAAELGGLKDGR